MKHLKIIGLALCVSLLFAATAYAAVTSPTKSYSGSGNTYTSAMGATKTGVGKVSNSAGTTVVTLQKGTTSIMPLAGTGWTTTVSGAKSASGSSTNTSASYWRMKADGQADNSKGTMTATAQ